LAIAHPPRPLQAAVPIRLRLRPAARWDMTRRCDAVTLRAAPAHLSGERRPNLAAESRRKIPALPDTPRTPLATAELLPALLTMDEVATLLRTSRKAVYAMVERRQMAGVTRIGRRLLVRRDDLLCWLNERRAASPGGNRR